MKRISSPIESLITSKNDLDIIHESDYLIVGSGYGGAVAASRLAASNKNVTVLERGQEYLPGDFPYDIEDLPSHIRLIPSTNTDSKTPEDTGGAGTGGYANALFNLHIGASSPDTGSAVDVLVGSGLGGTSLINANVAEEPDEDVFKQPQWPAEFRSHEAPLGDAFKHVKSALNLTQRTKDEGVIFPKFTALQRIAKAAGTNAEPTTIAVSPAAKDNGYGLIQPECSDCGNCITGCNTGAKNTLDRNLLRAAAAHGAQLYTGASVLWIEPNKAGAKRWKVFLTPTVTPTSDDKQDAYVVLTDNLILAAGTLGSTEVLFRSQAKSHLKLSDQLGQRFSSNGDGIAFSYGQKNPVSAIAGPEQKKPSKKTGPTITGKIRTQGLTIEDASVPASMARVFAELTTTGAMLQRLANRHSPRACLKNGHDPVAASLAMAEHSQALLIMGDDGASGHLSYSAITKKLAIHFPQADKNPALAQAHALFSGMDRKAGFDSGQYVPNPLWKLLPDGADGALAGAMPAGRALTVHPLGGCGMGDTVYEGVVNHRGQVFQANGDIYQGLYVFDGAIIPTALGINPFLTIAALAWRNCDYLVGDTKSRSDSEQATNVSAIQTIEVPDRERVRPQPVSFEIDEQMLGELPRLPQNFVQRMPTNVLQRLTEKQGLVVEVQAKEPNGEEWLENPGNHPLKAQMTLYCNPIDSESITLFQPVGVRKPVLDRHATELLKLEGEFTIFCEDKYSRLTDHWEGAVSVMSYLRRRGSAAEALNTAPGFSPAGILASVRKGGSFYNVGMLQSRRRRIQYSFRSTEHDITIAGEKVLGFDTRLPRMWPALLTLQAQLQEGNSAPIPFSLTVNTEKLIDPGLVQIKSAAHLPQSLLFAGSLAGYFARSLLATQFWEFGGADTPDKPHIQRTTPRTLRTKSGAIEPKCTTISVPIRASKRGKPAEEIPLLLTNYANAGKPPVLMLHGLAQGSQIFWTDSLEKNLANYFFDEGFDVWLLDYRLSNHVLPKMSDKAWSIDEIAQFDIPMAIDTVCRNTKFEKVAIVAHCVGACGLAMATLRDPTLGKKVSAAVTNAIHPWVIPSPGNRFRAKLGGFYREWVPEALLNPIPSKKDTAIQNMTDRLGFGLARIAEDGEHDDHLHYGDDPIVNSICDRMTFLYGRMWNHANLARETHHAFIDMLGPAPIGVYQHLYHFTREQRITNSNGENVYLDRQNIQDNWTFPILFVHGGDSRVFNPHSARRSAKRLSDTLRDKYGSNAPAVGCNIYPGYGHMDVIFGKDAHAKCFSDYVSFIRAQEVSEDPASAPDWRARSRQQLVTGPILRAAWVEQGRIRLRFWGELKRSQAFVDKAIAVHGAEVLEEQEVSLTADKQDSLPRFRLIDVQLSDSPGPFELTIGATPTAVGVEPGQALHYHDNSWLLQLREFSENTADTMSFLVGSCRYPGSMVDNALSDKVYSALLERSKNAGGAQLLFLTGDQIYADATDQILEIKSPKTRYTDRYRIAFSEQTSPNFATLVKSIPTHFSLDDHELTDNWSGYLKAPTAAPENTAEYALDSATRFMGAGREQMPLNKKTTTHSGSSSSAARRPFYYALDHTRECLFPTFVADTRAQRKPRDTNHPCDHALIETDQWSALETWLLDAHSESHTAPKFIVSGSIISPLSKYYCDNPSTWRQQDGWAGYPKTLELLLTLIAKNEIRNVVFVGGDAHLSAVSQLDIGLVDGESGERRKARVWQIVSSGLYAPLPFANSRRENFIWDKQHRIETHTNNNLSIVCENTFLSDAYSQFVKVDATQARMTIGSFDADNQHLAEHSVTF
ncbi:MAG: alpha/beta fold hydrolase [Halioglobus sp.]